MTPTTISYVTGDATQPQGDGTKFICHVCNNVGKWGKGFVLAVSNRWTAPEADYLRYSPQPLGNVRLVWVGGDVWVVNMVAQHGLRNAANKTPIRYDVLGSCLHWIGKQAATMGCSVHMPRIGCGLAGGSWDMVEPLIQKHLCDAGVAVTVYDLEAQ